MRTPAAAITLPKASDIDYFNTSEAEGYSLYLLKLYEREGGFKFQQKETRQMKAIAAELRLWCDKVKDMLLDAPLPDLHILLASYDIPYRIAYRQPPQENFMRNVRINAVQRWAKGDNSISSTIIAKILRDEVHSLNFKTLEKKYGQFYFDLICNWIGELRRTGTFAGTAQIDTFLRLRILMTEKLIAENGSKDAECDKRQWAKSHQVKDLSALDTQTLRNYIYFANAASNVRGIPIEKQFENYIRLDTELDSRKDIDKYLHAALKIDIALKQDFLKSLLSS